MYRSQAPSNFKLDDYSRGYPTAGNSILPKEEMMTKQANKSAKTQNVSIPMPFGSMASFNGNILESYVQASQSFFETAFALNQELMRFAGERFEHDTAALRTLAQSKDFQDMTSFQSDFARSTAEAYQAEFSKLMDRNMEATTAVLKPFFDSTTALSEGMHPK